MFDPWVGKLPWRRKWQPTPVFLPGEFHGQRSLAGYSPWCCKESDTTEWLTLSLPWKHSLSVYSTWSFTFYQQDTLIGPLMNLCLFPKATDMPFLTPASNTMCTQEMMMYMDSMVTALGIPNSQCRKSPGGKSPFLASQYSEPSYQNGSSLKIQLYSLVCLQFRW